MYSPTEISTYLHCPRQWWYMKRRYVQEVSEMAKFGSFIHEVIEKYYKDTNGRVTPSEVAYKVFKHVEKPDAEISWILNNFVKWEQKRITDGWKLQSVEVRKAKEPFKGIIDAIFTRKQETIVVDWKTGFKTEIDDDYLIQGHIYRYLTNADKVLFLFLRANKVVEYKPKPDVFKELFLKFLNGIKSGNIERIRSKYCEYCHYRTVCVLHELGVTEYVL